MVPRERIPNAWLEIESIPNSYSECCSIPDNSMIFHDNIESFWNLGYGSISLSDDKKEFDTLDLTCRHRFRRECDVNQWVMKYWQLASGNFEPRSYKFSQCYHIKHKNLRHVCSDIREKRHSLICMNDTSKTVDFEDKKQKLIEVLEEVLPKKSSFEK